MQRRFSILKFQITNFLFIIILGTILHYTYNIFKQNRIIGIFSSVNESTWEHLKLLYFPILITIIRGKISIKEDYKDYVCLKTKGILISFSFIVIFFYTYTGVIGKSITFFNIFSYIVAAFLSEYYVYKNLKEDIYCNNYLSLAILIILFLCFTIFTFYPPNIDLFQDPVTGTYGIKGI